MEILLLGTGSADGWPNPFCACPSCRRTPHVRRPSSALLDDVVLLDCGPEAPRAAVQAGRSLAAVHTVLLTHDHPDHSAPMALLSRQWAAADPAPGGLQVVGPARTLARWRPWAAPGPGVRFVEVGPGDAVEAGAHHVRVLAAAHQGSDHEHGVLYEVTGPDGGRVLWATDTGSLPAQTVNDLRRLDVLLLEETFGDRRATPDHLDLVGFATELARLRAQGCVDDATQVVAVHLSHHNPGDPAELARRLAAVGARAGHDLERIVTGPRSEVTLVLGGARSGKSTVAEGMVGTLAGEVTYVATGGSRGDDPEWRSRVAAHRARRPSSWTTQETTDVVGVLTRATGPVLVDCLTLWLTTQLDELDAWDGAAGWEADLQTRVRALVRSLTTAPVPVVLVSNEVGSGVVPASASGRLFADEQGRLNARVAAAADRVLLVVAGHVLELVEP